MMYGRSWGKASAVAILAVIPMFSGMAPAAQPQNPSGALLAKAPIVAKSALGIGDRLKITFFEMLDVTGSTSVFSSSALRTFYQRMDLSGEYSVEQDGAISFPRLGRFQVEGRGMQDLQSELGASFAKVMGRSADVSVTVIERSPVYVLGPVKNPGAYKHIPGMMVLQAVALAGGVENGASSISNLVEGAHEMERLRHTADTMKRLLARRARLEAENNGAPLPQASAQLVALAGGEQGAQVFLTSESTLQRYEHLKRQQRQSEASAFVQTARNELETLKQKLVQLDSQKKVRADRLAELMELMAQGLTTRASLVNAQSELADMEVRREDFCLAIVQAEGRAAQAQQAMDRLALDNAANLMDSIASTDNEIAKAQLSLASNQTVAAFLDERNAKLFQAKSPTGPAYEIVRQGVNGPSTLEADETSQLLPGDVLKIALKMSKSVTDMGGKGAPLFFDDGAPSTKGADPHSPQRVTFSEVK